MNTTISFESTSAIISTKGAELLSLKKGTRELMWNGDPKYWKRTSPLLFPVVGRQKNDRYIWKGCTYPMPLHGIADSLETTIASSDSNYVQLQSIGSHRSQHYYPFSFELNSTFSLNDDRLAINRTVRNVSSEELPFCIGEHFGFSLPLNRTTQGYILFQKSEHTQRLFLNQDHLLYKQESFIGSYIPINDYTFQDKAIILNKIDSSYVSLFDFNNQKRATVFMGNYSALAIWGKKGASFVCIEPIHGFDSHVEDSEYLLHKPLLTVLQPNEAKQFQSEILFS